MAQKALAKRDCFKPLGHRWVDRFLRRHERVKAKPSALLDTARTRGSTKAAYEDFYGRLKTQLDVKDVLPRNITNMDEHSMQERSRLAQGLL
jgi:hypothetical protein